MKDLKIPITYMPGPAKSNGQQAFTFEGYVIAEWAKAKSKKDRQKILNKIHEHQKMSAYEYIMACLSLEKK